MLLLPQKVALREELALRSPMQGRTIITVFLLIATASVSVVHAQNQPQTAEPPTFTADYPIDQAGIFIKDTQWSTVANQSPVKTKAAHGIAASLSYGLVPAKVVAVYAGEHAPTRAAGGQPVLCICHLISLPGDPVLVRLHARKDTRELDGGKMIVYPVVGGAKTADANKSDLILVDISHPEQNVWLVRPQASLSPGEYALMLGTQNVSIFPFTVTP
jgi:hypothetical protein